MCGLVGMAGKLETVDEGTMKRLLVIDFWRGEHATGFASLKSYDKSIHTAKIDSDPFALFGTKAFTEACNGVASSVFLGHNRHATTGAKSRANAHPFTHGHITGAHNGTLKSGNQAALEKVTGGKFDVDSEAIIHAIATIGVEETIPLLDGAWALTWINTEENTINFIRNKERPFWIAYDEKFEKLFWASEWQMIKAAAELSTHDYKFAVSDKGYRFHTTEPDWWYKFDIDQLKKGSKEHPKPRAKELKGKEPAPAQVHKGYTPFPTPTRTTSHTHTAACEGNVSHIGDYRRQKESDGPGNIQVLSSYGTQDKPFGDYMTKEEFEKIAKFGCSWCQADVSWGETGVTVWKEADQLLCPDCSVANESNRFYIGGSSAVSA